MRPRQFWLATLETTLVGVATGAAGAAPHSDGSAPRIATGAVLGGVAALAKCLVGAHVGSPVTPSVLPAREDPAEVACHE